MVDLKRQNRLKVLTADKAKPKVSDDDVRKRVLTAIKRKADSYAHNDERNQFTWLVCFL